MTASVHRSPSVSVPGKTASARSSSLGPLDLLALVAIGFAPFLLVLHGSPDQWRRGVIFQCVDALLTLLFVVGLPATLRGAWGEKRSVSAAAVVLFFGLLISALIHPWSSMGVATLLRFGGAIVLVHRLATGSLALRKASVKLWVALCGVEAVCVSLQHALDRRIGFPGEVGDPFEVAGRFKVPTGTLSGPHPVAAMGLVGLALALYGTHHRLIPRSWGIAGATSGAVLVGLTAGGTSFVSLGLVLLVAVVAEMRTRRKEAGVGNATVLTLVVVTVLSFGGSAAANVDSWRFKADRSVSTNAEAVGNGRVGMMHESWAMIKRWPVAGVGPGRFLNTRDAHPDLRALASEDQPVHNVPMLIVTEAGALGALGLLMLVVALARASRKHSFALVLLASMSGHLMFDHAPWTFGGGMVYLALILGLLGRNVSESVAVQAEPTKSLVLEAA